MQVVRRLLEPPLVPWRKRLGRNFRVAMVLHPMVLVATKVVAREVVVILAAAAAFVKMLEALRMAAAVADQDILVAPE